jgi:hypothetical protein
VQKFIAVFFLGGGVELILPQNMAVTKKLKVEN